MVRDQLVKHYGDRDINREGLRIYTSLDPDLQTIAAETVHDGMRHVDDMLDKRYERHLRSWKRKHGDTPAPFSAPRPQVALVAMDPHTGQVLALIGGRHYGASQLDHALSQRPTGSIFKPIVYATAFNSSLTGVPLPGQQTVFTPLTKLNDDDTTFTFDNGTQTYSPHNFKHEQLGIITARTALMESQNIATIELAQMVGLDNVVALAHSAGIASAQPTPSVAIGAYDASPLQMAAAYTVFANNGLMVEPNMVASVRTPGGDVVDNFSPTTKPVLDPRVAYLTLSLMRDVINHGTAEGVRAAGFSAPAAGKTGTSHDAWFAGFTSNLLCVIWVGNDDYTDIDLQGAQAAAPIWTAFMKKAVQLPQYSDTKFFDPPAGVTEVSLDRNTNLLADASCPDDYTVAFLSGTQPTGTCDHPNAGQQNVFQKIFGLGSSKPSLPNIPPAPANVVQPAVPNGTPQQPPTAGEQTPAETKPKEEKKKDKKGFFGKIFGVFGGGGGDNDHKSEPNTPQEQQQQEQ
jgi:penicillin-binding protein 1B